VVRDHLVDPERQASDHHDCGHADRQAADQSDPTVLLAAPSLTGLPAGHGRRHDHGRGWWHHRSRRRWRWFDRWRRWRWGRWRWWCHDGRRWWRRWCHDGRRRWRRDRRRWWRWRRGRRRSGLLDRRSDNLLDGLLDGGCDGRCNHRRGRDGIPSLSSLAGHYPTFAYKLRFEMYCTTPSDTRYQTGSPARTRERQSVELIAKAGTSTRLTVPSGKP
jgi:hypothetical protein